MGGDSCPPEWLRTWGSESESRWGRRMPEPWLSLMLAGRGQREKLAKEGKGPGSRNKLALPECLRQEGEGSWGQSAEGVR